VEVNTLLLGPGKSRSRFQSDIPFGADDENLWVVEYNSKYKSSWPDARFFCRDLTRPKEIDLPHDYFHEIHAYEILNLLPGNASSFFDLWRWIWDRMVVGGKLYATVPHWNSQWIHAYPTPQRVYNNGLLLYLDRDSKVEAKENFDDLWPIPYSLKNTGSWDMYGNGTVQGFAFQLEKK
jgi:hypothetical protein